MSFADCLDDPMQREMYAYWRRKCAGRIMPLRSDIDPVEIPRLLPNILISERLIVDGRERWRYRLAGTAVVAAFGKDVTGHFLDDLVAGDYRDFITGVRRMVCEERRALFCESEYLSRRDVRLVAKRLLMPLTKDGARVDQIISLLVFHFGSPRPMSIELDRTEGTTRHRGPILAEA